MEPVLLARIQFYLTAGFHFVFIPINIGLSWYIVWFMLKYLRTKDIYYKNVSRFWIKLFGVTVAIGVPTGIILEFQFGTNWAEFARFTGAIFGIVLAIEVLFSFFLESVFLYVLLQGWNTKRITDKILFLSSIIMAIGATLSAFFILAANSWMHTPAGYTIVNGRVEVVDFLAATFNPSTVPRFLHTFNACLITASFFIIGISSWYLLKGKHIRFATESIKTALTVGLVSTIAQPLLGHLQAIIIAKNEPATLAAQEGLFNTQSGAPLTVIGIVTNKGVVFKIGIPHLLSLMVNFNPNSVVP
ncbi:MAG: cytochrome ubiquinol oxidase subunit I, partial [Promethearchaeota archaeon]